LHFIKFATQIFFFAHKLLLVTVVRDSLIVAKFRLHVIIHGFKFLFVLKPQLLLHQVFLVGKLPLESCFFVLEHLSVPLFNEVSVIGKVFLSISRHAFVLP